MSDFRFRRRIRFKLPTPLDIPKGMPIEEDHRGCRVWETNTLAYRLAHLMVNGPTAGLS